MKAAVETDLATIEAALAVIPAHDRDTWVSMGMAVKSELGEAGFDLWDRWSRTADNYKERAAQSTWRSIKPTGDTRIGTLFYLAKEHGWQGSGAHTYTRPTAEERAERASRDRHAREAEAEEEAEAARTAQAIWGAASPAPADHGYLQKKGVKPHGLRLHHDGRLLIPIYQRGGVLSSLEFIDGAGTKRYLEGGRKPGGSFALTPPGATRHQALVIAEGFATAAAIFESTGLPTIIAFDAPNLMSVALWACEAFPDVTLIFAVDQDLYTDGRRNTGLDECTAAAQAVNGFLAVPELNGTKCDFNDLYRAKGAEAVAGGDQKCYSSS